MTNLDKITLNLCESMPKPPVGKNWSFEKKLDGVRACAIDGVIYNRKNGTNELNRPINQNFPEVKPDGDCVLDGEMVVENGDVYDVIGRSNLTDTFKIKLRSQYKPAELVAFDVLYADGRDLRGLPLSERKQILHSRSWGTGVSVIEHTTDGEALWNEAKNNGCEGIVAKRIDSPYVGKRCSDWIKCKCWHYIELPIERSEYTPEGGFVIYVKLPNGEEQRVAVQRESERKKIVDLKGGTARIRYLEFSENGRLRKPSWRELV